MLALMSPVTTSTDGRCVATTRWMPTARAICAMRQIAASTSRGATIMRSESSSTTTRMYGSGSGRARRRRRFDHGAASDRLVVELEVAHPVMREHLVAHLHLADDPVESRRGLLRER